MSSSFNDLPKKVDQVYEMLSDIMRMLQQSQPEPKTQEKENFLLVQQASEYLSLTIPTVYGLIHRNEIPYYKRGKRVYFLEKDLEAWLKKSRKKTVYELREEADQKLAGTRRFRNNEH